MLLRKVKITLITQKELWNDLEATGSLVSRLVMSREELHYNIKRFQPRKTSLLIEKHSQSVPHFQESIWEKGTNFKIASYARMKPKLNYLRPMQLVTCTGRRGHRVS